MPACSRIADAKITSSSARYLVDKFPESPAPRFGERRAVSKLARRIEVDDSTATVGHRVDGVNRPARKGTVDQRQRITAFNVAGFQHAQIPAGAAALQDQLRHVETTPAASELPARRARLRNLNYGGSNAIRVADRDVMFALLFD